MAAKRWIPETLFDELEFRMTYAAERVLYEMHTEHQHLILFEHKFFGKVLMLDGATQVTSKDEFIYHEMMTHVPILAHGRAREVLIEPWEKVTERALTAEQQRMHVPPLRDSRAMHRPGRQSVALQNNHAIEVFGECPRRGEPGYSGADYNSLLTDQG